MNEPEELNELYTAIAFDTGETTGWAVMSVYPEVMGPIPFELWLRAELLDDIRDVGSNNLPRDIAAYANKLTAKDREPFYAEWSRLRTEASGYRILDNVVFWSAGQFTGREDDQADEMISLVEAWPDRSPIVVEDFILRQFRQDRTLLSPVRINAKFEYLLRNTGIGKRRGFGPGRGRGRQFILQQPSMAKTTISDERLKAIDNGKYYRLTAGRPHARDAIRHVLTFLRREKAERARGKFGATLEQTPVPAGNAD